MIVQNSRCPLPIVLVTTITWSVWVWMSCDLDCQCVTLVSYIQSTVFVHDYHLATLSSALCSPSTADPVCSVSSHPSYHTSILHQHPSYKIIIARKSAAWWSDPSGGSDCVLAFRARTLLPPPSPGDRGATRTSHAVATICYNESGGRIGNRRLYSLRWIAPTLMFVLSATARPWRCLHQEVSSNH